MFSDNEIISGQKNGVINIWNIDTCKLINTFIDTDLIYSNDEISCFLLLPKCNIIVYGTSRDKIKIFDVQTFSLIYVQNNTRSDDEYQIHKYCVCISPDDKKIVFENNNGTIEIWNIDFTISNDSIFPPKSIHILTGHHRIISDICFSFDGTKIISGGEDRTIKVWDAHTGNLIIAIHNKKPIIKSR